LLELPNVGNILPFYPFLNENGTYSLQGLMCLKLRRRKRFDSLFNNLEKAGSLGPAFLMRISNGHPLSPLFLLYLSVDLFYKKI